MPTTSDTTSAVDEVLRHHAVDRLAPVWRTDDEKRRHDTIQDRLAVQDFGRILGIFTGFIALLIGGIAVAGSPLDYSDSENTAPLGVIAVIAGIFAIATYAHFARRSAKTHPLLADVTPFLTTPAAGWAYQAMWADQSSDHERAEQFRATLHGLPAETQVAMPEHAALLTLGHAAAAGR